VYSQRTDTTPDAELGVLAAVFRLALDSHAKNEATRPGGLDDGTKSKEDSANEHIIR
jgi:hypothetical protein